MERNPVIKRQLGDIFHDLSIEILLPGDDMIDLFLRGKSPGTKSEVGEFCTRCRKKLYQLVAVIVLVVAVAAASILTGMRKSTPVSEAQASSVLSSLCPPWKLINPPAPPPPAKHHQ